MLIAYCKVFEESLPLGLFWMWFLRFHLMASSFGSTDEGREPFTFPLHVNVKISVFPSLLLVFIPD